MRIASLSRVLQLLLRRIIPSILPAAALPLMLFLAACDPTQGAPKAATPTNAGPVGQAAAGHAPGGQTIVITSELQFLDLMVPHHQLAISMANIALKRAGHGEVKGLSKDIVIGQTDEINRMKFWRGLYYPDSPTPDPSGVLMPWMSMPGMNVDLNALDSSANFDHDFIGAMLPHHETAIDMARTALPYLSHTEVRDFAQDIITVQQKEIDRMLLWQQQWFK